MLRLFFRIIFTLFGLSTAIAQIKPDPINAMQNPSKHAWDLFLLLNHPAKAPSLARGEPDWSKKIGDHGLTVWETWKLARTEVFLANGCKPPAWEDTTLDPNLSIVASVKGKDFDLPKPVVFRAVLAGAAPIEATEKSAAARLLADIPDGLFGQGGGETRMNRATFEFIVNNPDRYELFNVEGQEALYEDIAAGRQKKSLSFPRDSIEAKAMWKLLTDEEKRAGADKRFHLSIGQDGKVYKLVALHIITKDVPKWFWTSFRQTDGPLPEVPSVDTAGRPSVLNGTKWEFYELSGTQTDFTDEFGRSILLSDPHIEDGFQKSSCITCHALATIGRKRPVTGPIPPAANNINFAEPSGVNVGMPIGAPNPNWFFEPRGFRDRVLHQDYVQLDFLWSMPFRATRKSSACPPM